MIGLRKGGTSGARDLGRSVLLLIGERGANVANFRCFEVLKRKP